MIEGLDAEVVGTEAAKERRDEVVAAVTDHAGRIARELAVLQGGDYGQETFQTDRAEWTVKFEAGAIQYLRYDDGTEVYVVSEKVDPEPGALATAMADYDAFVAAYNEYVASLDGVLDDVETEFPAVASTESVAAERDAIVDEIRSVCDRIAGQIHRYEGTDYGTFATTVDGTRWELKREGAQVSYLRVGGEGGRYLVSQYEPPSARTVRDLVDGFAGFVAAYNDHVADLEADLDGVAVDVDPPA